MNSRQAPEQPDSPRRQYNSTRRSMQASQTRTDVLQSAIRLFSTSGWAATTVAAIASDAGVAVETVYSGFGSKKGLLRAAMDVAVVGDTDPIPFAEREAFHRLSRGSRAERMLAGVDVQTDIHERSAGVWRAIVEAAAGDGEVDGWRVELEQGRRVEVGRSVNAMMERELDARTLDLVWVLFAPEVYLKLTRDVGLSRPDYEAYVLDAFERLTAPAMKQRRTADR